MTFAKFLAFLHECGLDVILLGLVNGAVGALAERLYEKFALPARLKAGLPFLTGILLYAVWFAVGVRDFSDPEEALGRIARRGFGTGIAAVAFRSLKTFLPSAATGEKEESAQTAEPADKTEAEKQTPEETDAAGGMEEDPSVSPAEGAEEPKEETQAESDEETRTEGEKSVKAAVFRSLLSGCLEEPGRSRAADELALANANDPDKTAEILGKYLSLSRAEEEAIVRLIAAVGRYLPR